MTAHHDARHLVLPCLGAHCVDHDVDEPYRCFAPREIDPPARPTTATDARTPKLASEPTPATSGPQQALTRLAAEDVREGDRVQVQWQSFEATVHDIMGDGDVGITTDDGGVLWLSLTGDRHDRADLYLIDRPEPEDPAVAVVEEWLARETNGSDWAPVSDLLARIDAARADQ